MRVHAIFLLSLFISCFLPSSAQNDQKFQVTGAGHCSDCQDSNFKTNQAFSGLHVSIDCKLQNGDMKRFAVAPLTDDGQFHVSIPGDIVDGKSLKHDCFAQLHSAAAVPCPTVDPLGAKIVFKSAKNGNYVFAPNKKLGFTAALCTSKFLWPHFKYPPLPTTHPWLKNFGHPWMPPIYKHPFYKHPFFKPPTPVYTPPVTQPQPPPVVQPQPPPVPVYTPPPIVKPHPPIIYKPHPPIISKPPKKPCPPTKPKPKPPVIVKPPKKPCPPKAKPPVIVKPPVVVKPLPPVPIVKPLPPPVPIVKPLPPLVPIVKPPFYKKPCPPLPFPKFPPKSYFKHPLLPKFPPKYYFKHPKLGSLPKFPPLPPHLP